jgi:hypothetical protein
VGQFSYPDLLGRGEIFEIFFFFFRYSFSRPLRMHDVVDDRVVVVMQARSGFAVCGLEVAQQGWCRRHTEVHRSGVAASSQADFSYQHPNN